MAYAINAAGLVVGYALDVHYLAVLWSPLPPPTSFAARAVSARRIDLSWIFASDNGTFFLVRRSTRTSDGTFSPFVTIATLPAGAVAYADVDVSVGATYRYQVQACSALGCGTSPGVIVTVPRVPVAPATVSAALVPGQRIDLAWTDASTNETSFRVRRSTRAPDGTYRPFETIGTRGEDTTRYTDSTVQSGGVYRYQVAACNVSGCASSDFPFAVAVALVPAAPAGVEARAVSATRVDLRWTDASTNESSFQVQRSTRAFDGTYPLFETITTLRAGSTAYVDSTVQSGYVYRYRVAACNVSGCALSDLSPDVTVAPAPTAPVGVGARAVSGTRVDIRWTDASDDETAFRVQRSTRRPDGTFPTFQTVGTAGAGVTVFSDDTVAGGSTYQYRVQACRNGVCASSASTPVTVPAS